MIDFISTNPDADPQTVACARLLAAVIAQAVEDASNSHSVAGDALAAIDWLFSEGTSFEKYAVLIGANPQALRDALLAPLDPHAVRPKLDRFDESKRRRFRSYYAKWLIHKQAVEKLARAEK
jgi:hypothetical protein